MKWATFRRSYDNLPIEKHQQQYNQLANENANQRRFSEHKAREFLSRVRPARVIELGGWDGELASIILPASEIESWFNFELSSIRPVCDDERFQQIVSASWAWDDERFIGDCFVSSHCLEHLSNTQLWSVLDALDAGGFTSAFTQVPLPAVGKPDWEQWPNSGHILDMNAVEFDEAFVSRGWEAVTGERLHGDHISGWVRASAG